MKARRFWWACLIALSSAIAVMCVVDHGSGTGAQEVRQPFSNAVSQRAEMIRELKEIKSLLKEQNALLRQLVEKGRS